MVGLVALVILLAALELFARPRAPFGGLKPSPGTLATTASSTQPKISWSTPSLDLILSPGESTSRNLTFSSDRDLTNVTLEAVPEIARFVTLQPTSFASIPAGHPQPVHLAFAIPTGTALGTYDGTIHVRVGNQTLPQTLKISVEVWQRFISGELGIAIDYPPNWFVRQQLGSVIFSNVQTPSPLSDTALATESFFEVHRLVNTNPGRLPVDAWFDAHFAQGFATAPLVRSSVAVGGQPAVRIETSEVGRRVHVYISDGADVIEVAYGLFAQQFVDQYAAMLNTLTFGP